MDDDDYEVDGLFDVANREMLDERGADDSCSFDEEKFMELERAVATFETDDDVDEGNADDDDGAATYVPREVAIDEENLTYVPKHVDDDGFTIAGKEHTVPTRDEEPYDEREVAIDELAQVSSIFLKHPHRFLNEAKATLGRRVALRIAAQTGQKQRRLFGRWLKDFVERVCATPGPEELLSLLTISTRAGHPAWSIEQWRSDVEELRDDDGFCHGWEAYSSETD